MKLQSNKLVRILSGLWFLAQWITPSFGITMTVQQKTDVIEMHHKVRQGVYPSASNMNYLVWNSYLESLAQLAADKCIFAHNYDPPYSSLGENIYKGFRSNLTQIVQFWFTESLLYTHGVTCNLTGHALNTCGHYWQTVGGAIEQIGCAIQSCSNTTDDFIVFCEYDRGAPGNVYVSGNQCSRCEHPRGLCYNDQCVNVTTKADIISKDVNATFDCKVECMNCATKSYVEGSGTCTCTGCDTTRYFGTFCETLKPGFNHTTTCSTCTRMVTPCLNGGNETNPSSSECLCSCTANYVGPQCQIPRSAYENGAQITLQPPNFCYSTDCMGYPVNRIEFSKKIWPSMQTTLISEVNTFCSNSTNYATCCPNGGSYSGGGVKNYITASNLKYLDFETITDGLGRLVTVLYADVQFPNALCTVGSGIISVPYQVLLNEQLKTAISNSVKQCCGLEVTTSLIRWKSTANSKYTIESTTTTTTTTTTSGGTTTTTTTTTAASSEDKAASSLHINNVSLLLMTLLTCISQN